MPHRPKTPQPQIRVVKVQSLVTSFPKLPQFTALLLPILLVFLTQMIQLGNTSISDNSTASTSGNAAHRHISMAYMKTVGKEQNETNTSQNWTIMDPPLPSFDQNDENDHQAGIAVDRVPILQDENESNSTGPLPGNSSSMTSRSRSEIIKKRKRDLKMVCENNGTFFNGKCECRYPFVGPRCVDYACEHGLSVGPRYDPDSLFFNRKCICDEDWAGDLCNVPIADQCNERGQYKNGRCKCHGYYFGPKCQYVGKCVNGKLQEGRCICTYGYEGDYCDKIVCHHGYHDKTNNSESCICPPRHTGIFCDECLLKGDYIIPFPNCTEERVPHWARISREKTDTLIFTRVMVLLGTMSLLGLFFLLMFVMHWGRHRASDPNLEVARRREMEERTEMLKRAIWQSVRHSSTHSTKRFDTSINSAKRFDNSVGSVRRNSSLADPNYVELNQLTI